MLTFSQLIAFTLAALVVLVIPGPGVIYVVARSISQGAYAGFVSALGLSTGVLVHVLAAVGGLSAILLSSATAFAVVKYLGAAFLIWLGIGMIRSGRGSFTTQRVPPRKLRMLFVDGVLVSTLNPKIAVFFIAFLPQFVSSQSGNAPLQIMMLGLLYAGLALITDSLYGLGASRIGKQVGGTLAARRWPKVLGGSLLIGLGIRAAFARATP